MVNVEGILYKKRIKGNEILSEEVRILS